jgi:hypothetical protein
MLYDAQNQKKGDNMNGAKGKYRTRGVEGATDTAYVKDRSIAFDIDEQSYRWRGYEPTFDELPWKEDLPKGPILGEATSRRYR